ncbi:hypothetical protein HanXRQr2_Chr10g0443101 [Helianthus annuus]|uniref:Uncharacterized protein n=1 Tax=Helianthus annuus TaxID=4232 RepID=A0A9K3HXC9_HELAN|nr:hypothetical protein HanXRQr2_Chr10g0443101 [Helianthus annuus]
MVYKIASDLGQIDTGKKIRKATVKQNSTILGIYCCLFLSFEVITGCMRNC